MSFADNDYCRLCADLKQSNNLINMRISLEKRQETVNMLARFNISVDFDNDLPKTVCFKCINSLEMAYDFVSTVEVAQAAFEDYDPTLDVKDEDLTNDDTNDSEVSATSINNDTSAAEYETDIKITTVKQGTSISNLKKVIAISKSKLKESKKPKIETNANLESWEDYSWLCCHCDKYFLSHSELSVHSMQYHGTCNPYRCLDCRGRVLHIDNFISHICQHHPGLSLACYKCSQVSSTVKEMKAHKATHCNTKYICVGCNTTFTNKNELDDHTNKYFKHVESDNIAENYSLTCVLCERTLKTKVLLNRHLLIHTERKRSHICDTCGKSFYRKKELIQHTPIHSEARPFKCEVCKFSFKVKTELKRHAAIHFGPKRFACEECGRCFRLRKELAVHSAVHTDKRPYACTQCNKSFRFKHLLIQHSRLHTGIKPYSCPACSLAFRNWSNFNKHTRDMHGLDNVTRKRTSDGLYAVDPKTKKVVYPETDKVLQWKKKILAKEKKGRPRKIVETSENSVKCDIKQDDKECVS